MSAILTSTLYQKLNNKIKN